jgi:uncharacterized protein DUF4124
MEPVPPDAGWPETHARCSARGRFTPGPPACDDADLAALTVTEFKGFNRGRERHSQYVCGHLTRSEDPTMHSSRNFGAKRTTARVAIACGAAAFLSCAWLSASADTEVYKWVDPQGRIHYSDRPPPSDGKLLSVESSPSAHAHVAASAPSAAASSAARAATPAPALTAANVSPRMRAAVADDVANARVEQCKAAQEKYQNYVRSHHLFREGPNQERVYLTDAELETERLNAKREADEACAGS